MKATEKSMRATYQQLKNLCNMTQIGCFLYAFLSMCYWFCNLAKAPFTASISFFFEPIYDLVRLFYVQKTLSVDKGDLSGVIASIVFVIFAVLLRITRDYIVTREELFELKMERKRREDDLKAQKQIEREYYNEMRRYNKFIVLVNLNIRQIQSYLFDNDVDEDDLRGIKLQVVAELFRSIEGSYVIQKAKYENDSFYITGLIEKTPECLKIITQTIRELAKKYSEMNLTISYDLSFDAISDKTDIKEKLDFLKKVIQLKYDNSTLTTSLFKTCYEIISHSQMRFTVLGKFQFLLDGKSSNYELYSVKIN